MNVFRAVFRITNQGKPIGDRRPAPANLPALCPELRARLAAEGIEQVFLVQVTVLPELLAAAESPLPPADLCVSAPAGRGKTLPFVLPLVQARRRGAPAAGAEGFSLAHLRYLVIDEADRVIEMAETGWLKAVERVAAATARRPASPAAAVCAPHLPLQKLPFLATLFTTPAELSESFNVVAPQPLLMHNLLRQPDWWRSLVLVNWNEAAHQLELPLSVLGAREAEFPGAVPAGQRGGGARQLRCWCARGYGARY
ncbi:ATP-dependent RNA helicase DDX51 [Amphibalanus amphitrite]|uniref:ATP-dependent RNA helicase n=1 Tax=Amphibalanus amphitrite TaxID=1232801 RepID=A0A6A4VPV5_AMPAM|nr:ATP-dependent RNA helicase DDX51 [Amphibalanus amphitrite]